MGRHPNLVKTLANFCRVAQWNKKPSIYFSDQCLQKKEEKGTEIYEVLSKC